MVQPFYNKHANAKVTVVAIQAFDIEMVFGPAPWKLPICEFPQYHSNPAATRREMWLAMIALVL